MPNPATITDVTDRFRPLTDAETVNANAFLDDAWAILTGRLPHLEDNINAGAVAINNVVRVVANMVVRVLRNPEGLSEEMIDDYRYRRDALVASGAMVVTPDEIADLTPAASRRRNSIRLVAYGDS